MPYIIRPRKAMVIAGAVGSLLIGAAPAGAETVDTSMCTAPLLTQPFASVKDTSNYVLAPGEPTFEGWTLSNGASVKTAPQAGSETGPVLDMPSGSKAVSPTMCVSTEYPTARLMLRDVVGGDAVSFNVSYAGTPTWEKPKNTGSVKGTGSAWTLSPKLKMDPFPVQGWQLVKITLIAAGKASDINVYDLYIDPYSR